jgi:hypothetical protein
MTFILDANFHVCNILEINDKERLPLYLQEYHVSLTDKLFDDWINSRCIPVNRENIDRVLPKLGVSNSRLLITKWFFASLTDHYWITPKLSEVIWEDINLFQNSFTDDFGNILMGTTQKTISMKTPDTSLGGQLKKKWKIVDDIRILIKDGSGESKQEIFNEVIATEICNRLKIDCIPYSLFQDRNNVYCACPCFASNDVEFVSAYDILGTIKNDYTISMYEHYITTLENYGISNVRQKLEHMLLLDFIMGNIDRHFNNFGVLRNSDTLKFLDVAPIFDTGSSLGSNKAAPFFHIDKNDEIYSFETDEFAQFHLIKNKYDLSSLKDIDVWVKDFLNQTQYVYSEKINKIIQFLNHRIEYAISYFKLHF